MNDTKISLWFNKTESCFAVSRNSNTERVNLGINLYKKLLDIISDELFNRLKTEIHIEVQGEIAEKISNLVFID